METELDYLHLSNTNVSSNLTRNANAALGVCLPLASLVGRKSFYPDGKKSTSAVSETNVSRHNGRPNEGPPHVGAVMVRGVSRGP